MISRLALFLCLAQDGEARAEPEEGPEPKNVFSTRAAYMSLFNKPRQSDLEGASAPHLDHLGGFILSYERVVLPRWLSVEFAKPFYFGYERFDSPFDLSLNLFHEFGRFEPFVGTGITFNIRVFDREREEIEGKRNDLSFGIAVLGGFGVRVAPRWKIIAEAAYAYIPLGSVVDHELGGNIGPAFMF